MKKYPFIMTSEEYKVFENISEYSDIHSYRNGNRDFILSLRDIDLIWAEFYKECDKVYWQVDFGANWSGYALRFFHDTKLGWIPKEDILALAALNAAKVRASLADDWMSIPDTQRHFLHEGIDSFAFYGMTSLPEEQLREEGVNPMTFLQRSYKRIMG